MEPRVSVIVPVYNVQDTVERCLDSLVRQTLDDIEIVVVNDGSTDGSQAIVEDYASKYPDKIRAYVKENGGISSARNFGICQATGKYLAFVDSDDYVDYDFCERMSDKAEETGADVVASPITYVWNRKVVKRFYNKRKFGVSVLEEPCILQKVESVPWNKIYRRQFWLDNGFEFADQWFEDVHLIYNVVLVANKVACVNIPFYQYVKTRSGSITAQADERLFDIFKSTDNIIEFYRKHGALEKLYSSVEHVCIKHILWRIELLRKSGDKEMATRFAKRAIAYWDEHFPAWAENDFFESSPRTGEAMRAARAIWRDRDRLVLYAANEPLPPGSRRGLQNNAGSREEHSEGATQKTGGDIQKYGAWLLHDVQVALEKAGITSFADFDTCLGLVRDAVLPSWCPGVHVGAVADAAGREQARIALERVGYRMYRQYVYGERVAAESYKFGGLKVYLHYYTPDSQRMRTLVFYRGPKDNDAANERHVRELTHEPVEAVRMIDVQGAPVAVPQDAELFLLETYGAGWRALDGSRAGLKHVAARELDVAGYYRTVHYSQIKMRTRETPQPVLFYDRKSAPVDWDEVHRAADQGYDPVVIGWSKTAKKLKRHPRVRYYIDDGTDADFVEGIRRRVCGDAELREYVELNTR